MQHFPEILLLCVACCVHSGTLVTLIPSVSCRQLKPGFIETFMHVGRHCCSIPYRYVVVACVRLQPCLASSWLRNTDTASMALGNSVLSHFTDPIRSSFASNYKVVDILTNAACVAKCLIGCIVCFWFCGLCNCDPAIYNPLCHCLLMKCCHFSSQLIWALLSLRS